MCQQYGNDCSSTSSKEDNQPSKEDYGIDEVHSVLEMAEGM